MTFSLINQITHRLNIIPPTLLLGLMALSPTSWSQDKVYSPAKNALVINDIVCRGNENTECSFISKKYYQQIGDLVDSSEVADARLRLGTLQQFKNVSVILEKTPERGRVNVVFIVREAQHIQYSLGTSYSNANYEFFESEGFGLTAGVTDFNFMGTGKQLTLGLSTVMYDSSLGARELYSDSSSNSYSASADYYDPHLFDSAKYYLRANAHYSRINRENSTNFSSASFQNEERTIEIYGGSLQLGRRFGQHSYFEISAGSYSGDFDTDLEITSVAYGWDSRDDLIFPTKGSNFSAAIRDVNPSFDTSLFIDYSNNISLNDQYVFTYGISNEFILEDLDNSDRNINPTMTMQLSDIDSSRSDSGSYNGWKYGISLPMRKFDLNEIGLSLTYTYQTDALILNFTASYQTDFEGAL